MMLLSHFIRKIFFILIEYDGFFVYLHHYYIIMWRKVGYLIFYLPIKKKQ